MSLHYTHIALPFPRKKNQGGFLLRKKYIVQKATNYATISHCLMLLRRICPEAEIYSNFENFFFGVVCASFYISLISEKFLEFSLWEMGMTNVAT